MIPTTCALLTSLALASSDPATTQPTQPGLSFGRFGSLTLYQPIGTPTSVVLFASGDGGWNLGVVGMAERLRARGAVVVGFDVRSYLRAAAIASKCTYAAADFEALSQYVQHQLGVDRYLPPVLVGYSSGATLVYVALAQSPPNTFKGGLSLGFCPDLPGKGGWCPGSAGLQATPLARNNGWTFQPAERLPAPWIVLQGNDDQACSPTLAAEFVSHMKLAEIVRLPKVGHGFGVEGRWDTALDQAFQRIVTAPDPNPAPAPGPVSDLPLIEVAAPAGLPPGDLLAIMFSGDGGWAGIDREVSQTLAARGIPVVGLNSLQYFWKARTREELGRDLNRILGHYLQQWRRERVLLLGYSFGADVMPFAIAELPAAMRSRVAGVGLLGLGQTASFEFHVGDWIGRSSRAGYPTWPALEKLPGLVGGAPVVCLFGAEETDTGCRANQGIVMVRLPGGHHFGGDIRGVADRLLSLLEAGRR